MAESITVSRTLDQASERRVALAASLKPGAHVHISGICGTGTSAVLSLLKTLGYRVSGSDKAFYPPMGEIVRSVADKVYQGYSPDNLQDRPDLVVIGNALSRDNPEVEYLLKHDIPFASMPEIFAALLIGDRRHCPISVVVCGTHGKTTTTAAIAQILDTAGLKPGYFIGGVPSGLATSIRPVDLNVPQEKRVVVLEGDEYDSAFFAKYAKFHSYRPDIAIITSLEFDHADIYNSITEIEAEFSRFVFRIPENGLLLVWDGSDRLKQLAKHWIDQGLAAKLRFYGESEQASYRLLERSTARLLNSQSLHYGQILTCDLAGQIVQMETPLSGRHNALNLLAAAAVAAHLAVPDRTIIEAVREFRGVVRRQQIIFNQDDLTVIEDFAHHPTAVQMTLSGLKEAYPEKRLVAVFEPRSNTSKRAYFQKEYGSSFTAADQVLLLRVADPGGYSNTEKNVAALDVDLLVADIRQTGRAAQAFNGVEDICSSLVEQAGRGDLVVIMSNGDFGGLPQKLVSALSQAG